MKALHKIRFLFHVLLLRLRHWKRVIVLERTGGLGDVICCIPAYHALKQKYPAHLILFATFKPFDALIKNCREIDAVYGIAPGKKIPQQKAAWLVDRHYEALTSDERGRGGQKLHLAHVFLKDCDLPAADWQPRIAIPAGERQAAAEEIGLRAGEIIIAIHTGRTWPVRELPEGRWQEIVDGLHKNRPCRILHFCSPGRDGAPVHKLRGVQAMKPDLPLLTTAAILSQCHLLIGIDSGLLHLAGTLGVPSVGIFGAVNPQFRLPLGTPAKGVYATLPCSFCQHESPIKHWQTGCPNDIRCMKEISAGQVMKAVESTFPKA